MLTHLRLLLVFGPSALAFACAQGNPGAVDEYGEGAGGEAQIGIGEPAVGTTPDYPIRPYAGIPVQPSAPPAAGTDAPAAPESAPPAAGPEVESEEPIPQPMEAEPEDAPVPQPQPAPAPQPEPDEPVDPNDPCQGVDAFGECQGSVLRWCQYGVILLSWDCTWSGQSCGFVSNEAGYDCGGQGGNPEDNPDPAPGPAPDPGPVDPGEGCGNPLESADLALVNQARQQNGLGPLACDDAATLAARLHSEDMCRRNYFSHDSLDGRDAGTRMRNQGGQFGGWGENIAYGVSTAAEVHDMWMNSAGHRANILSGGYRRLGVGYYNCNGTGYWTEDFMD